MGERPRGVVGRPADARGSPPGAPAPAGDPPGRALYLFLEYTDGGTGAGPGASRPAGWTARVARLIEEFGGGQAARGRTREVAVVPGAGITNDLQECRRRRELQGENGVYRPMQKAQRRAGRFIPSAILA